ncbi:RagB/SusD family nutrient uptake outer membrane protein [Chitinophaga sp. Hz27]|uniref:RagB/SusD family nutrient uptake outer membrane protein n=1 Tax=Chitinophaga sp. Hz27 TaxID=3347169 RepID=UPI0035DD818E
MKYKLLILISLCVLLGFSSCKKFLQEQSQSEVIPKTANDFRELLMGSGYMQKEEPMNFLTLMDDDVDFNIDWDSGNGQTYVGSSGAKRYFYYYTWQPRLFETNGLGEVINADPSTTAYYRFYELIKGCNAVLDNIDGSIGSQQEKDRVKGEALALRSFYYFRLVNMYGAPYNSSPDALAVPLKLNSNIVIDNMQQSTVKEVYEQILKDLKTAATLMDPLPIIRRDFHINQPAIHILLSRVYLFMEKWQDCINESNKVFDQGGILTDLTGLTTGNYISYNNAEIEWMYGGNAQGGGTAEYIPSVQFRSMFDVNDIRGKYGFAISGGSPIITKFVTLGSFVTEAVRTAEALLNRAEANVQLGNLAEAGRDLNDLRRNRIIGYQDESINDKTNLLLAVRTERRKELYMEGFRWFDLRRYGMPAITHRYQNEVGEAILQYTLAEKDPMYTLPFPNSLLLRNPALKQNPSGTMADRVGH